MSDLNSIRVTNVVTSDMGQRVCAPKTRLHTITLQDYFNSVRTGDFTSLFLNYYTKDSERSVIHDISLNIEVLQDLIRKYTKYPTEKENNSYNQKYGISITDKISELKKKVCAIRPCVLVDANTDEVLKYNKLCFIDLILEGGFKGV